MDISAPVTALTILPAPRGRWLRRGPQAQAPAPLLAAAAEPVVELTTPAPGQTVTAPVSDTSAALAALSALATPAPEAPLRPPVAAIAAPASTAVPAQPSLPKVPSTIMGTGGVHLSSAAQPTSTTAVDNHEIAALRAELRALASELDIVRQRSAAERMGLLEQLASTRDARLKAENELEAVQKVLESVERRLPFPRNPLQQVS